MSIQIGALAPRFAGATPSVPRYTSSSFGGSYTLLVFLPTDPDGEKAALGALQRHSALFDDVNLSAFGVLREPKAIARARDRRGTRWFLDHDGAISRLFGALTEAGEARPRWVLLDPMECVLADLPIDQAEAFFAKVRALPPPEQHAGVELVAPVLVAPRIFEPELCRALIDYYEAQGGTPSGVMRVVNGRTVHVLDDYKKRSDVDLVDPDLKRAVRARIGSRLLPLIEKAFQFKTTHIERYLVACYDAESGGHFGPHRDNTTPRTVHRRFACSINLNSEAFEGGDLRFPEFGPRTYRPPTGGAVIFSCSLLHQAMPVTQGRRYAFLPFFHDAKGEEARQANLKLEQAADPEPEAAQVE